MGVNTRGNAALSTAVGTSLSASTVGGQLQVSANGNLTTTGVVSANNLILSTATGSNGNITLDRKSVVSGKSEDLDGRRIIIIKKYSCVQARGPVLFDPLSRYV